MQNTVVVLGGGSRGYEPPNLSFKNVLVFDFEKMKPITLTRTKQKEKCVDHWIKPARKSCQVAENYLRLRSIRRELISVRYCFSFLLCQVLCYAMNLSMYMCM